MRGGKVKERYLKYEDAGNVPVGLPLTCIPPTSCEFGILPVYFSYKETIEEQIEDFSCSVFLFNIQN